MATDNVKRGAKLASSGYKGDDYKVRVSARSVVSIDDSDSPYTASVERSVILADATAGAITINLPAAANAPGMELTVKKTGTGINAVTLDPDGAELIDGGATFAALDAANDTATFVCDGTGWVLLQSNIA